MRALVPYLAYAYVSFVGLTTRLKVRNGSVPRALRERGQRFIYAFWHQRQVYFTWTHRDVGASVLVSRSKDGDIIASTMRLSRIGAVRGSSSRGGVAATLALVDSLKSGLDIGITPDGPKGPAREVKDGVLFMARSMKAPIVPITNALSHRIQVEKAWDKFQFPLPFGRAVVIYGEPIDVREGDDFEAKAAELKAALDRITAEADAEVSGGRA